jgi:hypothetical protein
MNMRTKLEILERNLAVIRERNAHRHWSQLVRTVTMNRDMIRASGGGIQEDTESLPWYSDLTSLTALSVVAMLIVASIYLLVK